MWILLIVVGLELTAAHQIKDSLSMDLVEYFTGKKTTWTKAPEQLQQVLQGSLDALLARMSRLPALHYELLVNGLSIALVQDPKPEKGDYDKVLMIAIKGSRRERTAEGEDLSAGIVMVAPKNFRKNMPKRINNFFSDLKRDHSDLAKLLMISFFWKVQGGYQSEFNEEGAPLKERIRFWSQIRASID